MENTDTIQINIQNGAAHLPTWGIVSISIVSLIFLIAMIFFCWSLYCAAKRVPEEKRVFPAWFCWMILIPIAGYVFSWIMLPFGLPRSFENHLADNKEAIAKSKSLFGIGLAYVIMPLLMWIPIVNAIVGIIQIVLWIIYWVKIVDFKKQYLMH